MKHSRNTIPLLIFVSRNPELVDCDQKSLKSGQRTSFRLLQTRFSANSHHMLGLEGWNGLDWEGPMGRGEMDEKCLCKSHPAISAGNDESLIGNYRSQSHDFKIL